MGVRGYGLGVRCYALGVWVRVRCSLTQALDLAHVVT